MLIFVDGNNDVVVFKQIDVPSPLLDGVIVDRFTSGHVGCEFLVEIGVAEVNSFRKLLVRATDVIFEESQIKGNEVVVEKRVFT